MKDGKKILEFNWNNIANGDVLDIQLQIQPPFEVTPIAAMEVGEAPKLYLIRNKRTKGLQQQARPNRADSNIGIGDGPVSVVGGRMYYAKFDTRNTNMAIVPGFGNGVEGLDAHSLFFFTPTENTSTDEYYSVNVNNVTTVMKYATNGVWDENGGTWYVQPDNNGAYSGYNIGATKLNATNMPQDAWCAGDETDVITFSNPNDDGTAWEFVKVADDDAKRMLNDFIAEVAVELTTKLDAITSQIAAVNGYDTYKIDCYKYMVKELLHRQQGNR